MSKIRELIREIEKIREKLNKSVIKNGLASEETKKISIEIDNLLNEYYKINRSQEKGKFYEEKNMMNEAYNMSYEHLKNLTLDLNDFPTIKVWEEYAKKNNCLSSQSMQYISGLNWNKLRNKVKVEVRFRSYKKK